MHYLAVTIVCWAASLLRFKAMVLQQHGLICSRFFPSYGKQLICIQKLPFPLDSYICRPPIVNVTKYYIKTRLDVFYFYFAVINNTFNRKSYTLLLQTQLFVA